MRHPSSTLPKSCLLHFATRALLFPALLVVSGCDSTIEPFAEKGTYSIYGYLETSRDEQFIRVKPLTVPVSKVDSASMEATVTLENRTKGTSEVLPDSIIRYEDVEFTAVTHNYWTDTPVAPGTKYRLTIDPADGPPVRATTITPTASDVNVHPRSGECRDLFKVVFEDIDDPRRVRARIDVRYLDTLFDKEWFSFEQKDVFKNEEGNVILLFRPSLVLGELAERVDFRLPRLPHDVPPWCWSSHRCLELDSDKIRIRYLYLGPEWYGNIPEDSLTYDPIRSHDVANGHGFFGSLRRDQTTVKVDTSSLIWTGGPGCGEPPPGS